LGIAHKEGECQGNLRFFPLFLGLFLLIPKSEKLGLFCSGEAKLSKGDWARILVLFGTMALTGVFALYYEAISNRRSFAEFVDLLRRSGEIAQSLFHPSTWYTSLPEPLSASGT